MASQNGGRQFFADVMPLQERADQFTLGEAQADFPQAEHDVVLLKARLFRGGVFAVLPDDFPKAGRDNFEEIKPWLAGKTPSLSPAEVAAHLSMSEGAVKVTIHRMSTTNCAT